MADEMITCSWEEIDGFASHSEFVRFCDWMNDAITAGKASKVSVRKRYQGIESFTEEWFEHIASSTIWRLVHPDGPFRGLFEQVDT
jgi:hypothetical protein